MEEMKFKTNMMCDACVSKVGMKLDEASGIAEWSVALDRPDKLLKVRSEGATAEDIIAAVRSAGYQIEPT